MDKDELVLIFKDWENQKDIIGRGKLVDLVSTGLPFILSDAFVPEAKQVTYISERWNVIFVDIFDTNYRKDHIYSFDIRKVHSVGLSSSDSPIEYKTGRIKDKFLSWNGKEIY